MKGTLIVLEGTDGSGKATQAKLLVRSLEARGISCREIDFPRYGNPFAEPANLYLHGALGGSPGDVNACAASVMFAVDRFASYKEDWGAFYESGGVVVANRYTTSNAVHQASKLRAEQRRDFLDWLFDLEYRRMGLPEPDLVLYLDMPTEAANRLLRRREQATNTRADIHEQDGDYLRRCRESAGEIARNQGWVRVECAAGGFPRTPEEIHREVWAAVQSRLSR
ncbi:MAG: thymidylate kinase [Oscillibacter sp.]|nr:thymidylate kinase [Oscillibacter sp.]